jgi:hypothetical protein
MQVGDLVKYHSNIYVIKRHQLCYGMIKKIKNDMALIFWHKNQPFTFSDKREQQSWVDMSSLIKISET